MSLADNILSTYEREWNIDRTPILPGQNPTLGLPLSCAVEHDFGNQSSHSYFEPMVGTIRYVNEVREYDSDVHEIVAVLAAGHCTVGWTTATTEAIRWVTDALRESATWNAKRLLDLGSGAVSAPVHEEPAGAATSDVAESELPARARRALRAVRELAEWLGVTEPDAADLAGGLRRSYFNWRKGASPYPATTLNLYESHSFVEALVDALGERGARLWLATEDEDVVRRSLLRDPKGRDVLLDIASTVLFNAASEAPQADRRVEEEDHDPPLSGGGQGQFGTPKKLRRPPPPD